MYSGEEHEDPLYTKLSKILELTSMIFGHYKNTGQKERAHSLIVWVVTALQAAIENRQKLYIVKPFYSGNSKVGLYASKGKCNKEMLSYS